jgi:hypothetical protein
LTDVCPTSSLESPHDDLTRELSRLLPRGLVYLQLPASSKNIDFASLPKTLKELHNIILEDEDGMAKLPPALEALIIAAGPTDSAFKMTTEMAKGLPKTLKKLDIPWGNMNDPKALSELMHLESLGIYDWSEERPINSPICEAFYDPHLASHWSAFLPTQLTELFLTLPRAETGSNISLRQLTALKVLDLSFHDFDASLFSVLPHCLQRARVFVLSKYTKPPNCFCNLPSSLTLLSFGPQIEGPPFELSDFRNLPKSLYSLTIPHIPSPEFFALMKPGMHIMAGVGAEYPWKDFKSASRQYENDPIWQGYTVNVNLVLRKEGTRNEV